MPLSWSSWHFRGHAGTIFIRHLWTFMKVGERLVSDCYFADDKTNNYYFVCIAFILYFIYRPVFCRCIWFFGNGKKINETAASSARRGYPYVFTILVIANSYLQSVPPPHLHVNTWRHRHWGDVSGDRLDRSCVVGIPWTFMLNIGSWPVSPGSSACFAGRWKWMSMNKRGSVV